MNAFRTQSDMVRYIAKRIHDFNSDAMRDAFERAIIDYKVNTISTPRG